MRYVSTMLALAIANYGWAVASGKGFDKATERTFFQAIALLCAWSGE